MQYFRFFLVKLLENLSEDDGPQKKMGLLTELSLDIEDNSARVLGQIPTVLQLFLK